MSNEAELQGRIRRKREAHTERDMLAESYRLKDRFTHIWSYPSRKRLFAELNRVLEDVEENRVLDYRCGGGASNLKYLTKGAIVYGIEISATYIAEAKRKVEDAGFPREGYQFHAIDAHALEFGDEAFDLVISEGILHYLDTEVALGEIYRVLKLGRRVLLLNRLKKVLLHAADRLECWMHKKSLLLSWSQYILFNLIKQ